MLSIEYKDYQLTAIPSAGDSAGAVIPARNSVLQGLVDLGTRRFSFSAL